MRFDATFLVACVIATSLVACGGSSPSSPAPASESGHATSASPNDEHHDEHVHHHTAPHGGGLTELGDHFAHLELTVDPASGTLTVFLLDGEAANAVRVATPALELDVRATASGSTKEFSVRAAAVAKALTGETVGDTSEFSVQSDDLKGAESVTATLKSIAVKGAEFQNVSLVWPQGTES